MENILLDLGFGWTSSKVVPFVLMIILGIGLFLIAFKRLKKKWMRIFSVVLILIPAFIYMVINPIYEGDFSNSYRSEKVTDRLSEIEKGRLTVLAIPGCQYCEAAVDDMKIIKSRIGNDHEIDFIVCTDYIEDLDLFEEKQKGELNIRIVKNLDAITDLAGHQFPAYVYNDGKKIKIWTNNQFGVRAKDWVEGRMD